jgi:hypothetical protein
MTRSQILLAACGLAGIAGLPLHAKAQAFVSGSQLTRACSGRSPVEQNSCDGYIAGVLDTVRDLPDANGKVCPPTNTKLSVMREALGRFGQQRSEEARGPGTALVVAFIKTTYPCPVK